MKILILTEVFFPDTIGGAGKYVYNVARVLVDKGHEVSLITRRVKCLAPEEVIEGVRVFRFNWSNRLNPLKLFSFLKEIFKTFEGLSLRNNFDLVVFNQPFSALAVVFSKKSKNIPKIYNFQSSWVDEFEIKSFLKHRPLMPHIIFKRLFLTPIIILMKFIERVVIFNCEKIITLSQYTKDRLQYLYGVPNEKIKIIPAGVDTAKFKPVDNQEKNLLRAELGISRESLVLFTARNLVPRMGLDNLLLAFSLIIKRETNIRLIIAGGGFLENKLKILTKKLRLSDRIRFTGELSEDDLTKYYQSVDLFILPTQFLEGFGIATIEALACGLPVLATPVGGTIEILGKFDRNFLFSGTDAQCICEKILEFIKNTADRKILSKRCRDFILENYSLGKFANETEKFYLSVAKKR